MTRSIERQLWYEADDGRVTLTQSELRGRSDPLVILGEAGMGKSFLLEWLAQSPQFALCSARQLLNRHSPATLLGNARVLVIDALDEVSAQKDGDGVDLVLRKLGELGYPPFILSCRVADWRSATGGQTIREQYGQQPLELHLQPLDDTDAIAFLADHLDVETAEAVVAHFSQRGLQGFLGNPQTLELIARVAGRSTLPETRGELFERAIEVLRVEHRDNKADNQLARETGLDAAGAAFASLILTGNEAIVRSASANHATGDLQIAEVARLPGGEAVRQMLDTRLFKADGADRFSYWHRRIGEFLGARWLANLANTRRKRARLLSLFHGHRLVPASLRGIHAWLARDPALAPAVLAADPMGVVEYGDTDNLSVENARLMLASLRDLSAANPRFRDSGPYSIRGIAQPALLEDVRELITSPTTPFALRLTLIESIKDSIIASSLANELRDLVLSPDSFFAIRHRAGDVLVEMDADSIWDSTVRALSALGDEMSVRLALELMHKVGYTPFDDDLIIDLVITYCSLDSRTIGVLWGLQRRIPGSRLEALLDRYASRVKGMDDQHKRRGTKDLTDFAYHLITRRVAAGEVDASKLWSWLEPFDKLTGYDQDKRSELAALIQQNASLRRGVQQLILIDDTSEQSLQTRSWRLNRASAGFKPSADDIVVLLGKLDPTATRDERWRELLLLVHHDRETGADLRAAARAFAAKRADLLRWLDGLAAPHVPRWQTHDARRKEKQRRRHAWKRAEQRIHFANRIDDIKSGNGKDITNLAMAYLGKFYDLGLENFPPHTRITQWVGSEIDEAAQIGFESCLALEVGTPSAEEIVAGVVEGHYYPAASILVVALAERFRRNVEFEGVTDECLLAGFFELRRSPEGIDGLEEAVETEVRKRGLWTDAMRRYVEPQLQARSTHVHSLSVLMQTSSLASDSAALAADWLMRYPDLPVESEIELVDRLIRSGRYDVLRSAARTKEDLIPGPSRDNWNAVRFITDFETAVGKLEARAVEPELLWHIRDRTSGSHRVHGITLTVVQLEWVIRTFRGVWQFTAHPKGGTIGDTNAWDATEYIVGLINSLGNNDSHEACMSLSRLANGPVDGYTETIKAVTAEQNRIRVESTYVAPTLEALAAIAKDSQPVTSEDLQAYLVEELALVQARVRSDDIESWQGFYDGNMSPHDEERCRDHLLGLLRQGSNGLLLEPETHVAADKEVDITCSSGILRLPIEIKGQWHPALWQAADSQLAALYTRDWRAEEMGIYLVLWFGENVPANKKLRGRGRGLEVPQTPQRLQEMLEAGSQAVRDGLVKVVVLDLART